MKLFKITTLHALLSFFILVFSFFISAHYAHASTIAVPANFLSLNSGLVGYWTMDGKDVVNGVALDKSGNGNNGNLINIATSTFYRAGKVGQGFNFDGVDDTMNLGTPSSLGLTGSMTISAWIKLSSVPATQKGIAGNSDSGGTQIPWLFEISRNTVGKINFLQLGSGAGTNTVTGNTAVKVGLWTHVVVVRNGSSGSWPISFYYNGVADGTATILRDPGTNQTSKIGTAGALSNELFPGTIDDVRIYNRALSAQEVAQLYNIGAATKVDTSRTASSSPLTSGLVGYWTMDGKDVVNGVALDKSGNGNNGNLINIATSTFYRAGKVGQGFNFDGVDDRVSLGTSVNSYLSVNNNFTTSLWFKTAIPAAAQSGSALLSSDVNSTDRTNIQLNSGGIAGGIFNGSAVTAGFPSYSVNTWNHVVMTKNNSVITLYLNNVAITTGGSLSTVSGSVTLLGARSNLSSFFQGSIDDVRIYNRALSAQEVAQLYSLGAATKIDVSPTASSSPLMGNGLVGYWTFDGKDVVNGVARDKSGQGNNTNFINIATSTFYAPGKIGQGIRCDGVNDYTSATDSTSLRLSNRFTISNWLKLDSTTQASYIQTKRNAQDEYAVVYGYVAGKYEFYAEGYSGGVPRTPLTTSVTDKKWHHVVWTYDGTRLRGYLDGNLDVTATITFTLLQTTGALRYCTSTGGTDLFRGYIDDPRIYNRQLSDQEVKALYGLGR